MVLSVESLWTMPEVELLRAYYEARREYVAKKFARDSQRARLEWLRAKTFVTTPGRVTERQHAVEVSEDLGRKGQELRELSRDLDLLKTDVDLIAMVIRMRGAGAPAETDAKGETQESEDESA